MSEIRHPNSVTSLGDPVKPQPDPIPWTAKAACADMNPELFFGPDGFESPEQYRFRLARAQQVCRGCEVSSECLEAAHANAERHGIWGGRDMGRRRGPGVGQGQNAMKTHCCRGHELNQANTYVYEGQRHCRRCRREDQKSRNA